LQSEAPASADHLDREPLATALAKWLTERNNTEHTTVGLFGDWGVGKSTFVNLLKQKLPQKSPASPLRKFISSELIIWNYEHRGDIQTCLAQSYVSMFSQEQSKKKSASEHVEFIVGEFNAWRYEHSGNIQAGLAQEFVNAALGDLNPLKKF
jgi:predicted KAP-like P-loop ATPase